MSVVESLMDHLRTYHSCPQTQMNSRVFGGKTPRLDVKPPEAEATRTKYLTGLARFVQLVKAHSERTIKFKKCN